MVVIGGAEMGRGSRRNELKLGGNGGRRASERAASAREWGGSEPGRLRVQVKARGAGERSAARGITRTPPASRRPSSPTRWTR